MIAPATPILFVLFLYLVVFVVLPITAVGVLSILWDAAGGRLPSRTKVKLTFGPLAVSAVIALLFVGGWHVVQNRAWGRAAAAGDELQDVAALIGFEGEFRGAGGGPGLCGAASAGADFGEAMTHEEAVVLALELAERFEAAGYRSMVGEEAASVHVRSPPMRDILVLAVRDDARSVSLRLTPGWDSDFELPPFYRSQRAPYEHSAWAWMVVRGCLDTGEDIELEDLLERERVRELTS